MAYYGNRAATYMMLCRFDMALADARQSIAIDPNFVKVKYTLQTSGLRNDCEFIVSCRFEGRLSFFFFFFYFFFFFFYRSHSQLFVELMGLLPKSSFFCLFFFGVFSPT